MAAKGAAPPLHRGNRVLELPPRPAGPTPKPHRTDVGHAGVAGVLGPAPKVPPVTDVCEHAT